MGVHTKKGIVSFCLGLILLCPVFADENQADSQPTNDDRYKGVPINTNDFSGYMETLKGQIQKSWYPPECLEHDGHALVKFSITRNGDVYAVQILESSGDSVYDESALEAIKKASPFAHFPAATTKGALTINYSFDTAVVNTGNMQNYLQSAEKFYNVNNTMALDYINRAIDEVDGDINAYFLYGKRSKIKQALGDKVGAAADLDESKRLKAKYDQKRIVASKLVAEMEQSPYAYFSLAHSYEIAGDYKNAIEAIDKAIQLTELNNNYKRYKSELLQKCGSL